MARSKSPQKNKPEIIVLPRDETEIAPMSLMDAIQVAIFCMDQQVGGNPELAEMIDRAILTLRMFADFIRPR